MIYHIRQKDEWNTETDCKQFDLINKIVRNNSWLSSNSTLELMKIGREEFNIQFNIHSDQGLIYPPTAQIFSDPPNFPRKDFPASTSL